jgi:hypothetical protein
MAVDALFEVKIIFTAAKRNKARARIGAPSHAPLRGADSLFYKNSAPPRRLVWLNDS